VWTIGTWALKAQLFADLRKLRLAEGAELEPPGACHFGEWIEEHYFLQLTNEHLALERFKGRTRRV
jgi:phage terminase large subunit GpA-like protein